MSDGALTKYRIWHASRDAYHCAFRLLRMLSFAQETPMEFERLRILDLFLLAPPQLHRISMPMEVKARFRQLDIPDADNIFVCLPSVNAMFQELRLFQSTAASYLVAKDIIRKSLLRTGVAEFNEAGIPSDLRAEIAKRNEEEVDIMRFLSLDLAKIPLSGTDNIYKRAGLPGRHLLS